MTSYARKKSSNPEVFEFERAGSKQAIHARGYNLAAWALLRKKSGNCMNDLSPLILPDDGRVTVVLDNPITGERLFTIVEGEYLVWEDGRFSVYSASEFVKIFKAQPEVKPESYHDDAVVQRFGGLK